MHRQEVVVVVVVGRCRGDDAGMLEARFVDAGRAFVAAVGTATAVDAAAGVCRRSVGAGVGSPRTVVAGELHALHHSSPVDKPSPAVGTGSAGTLDVMDPPPPLDKWPEAAHKAFVVEDDLLILCNPF